MNFFTIVISTLINVLAEIYSMHRIMNEKINFKSKRLYISYIIMVILIALNFTFSHNIYKVIITLIIMFLTIKNIFNKGYKESIIASVVLFLTTIFAELIFSFFVVLISNINNQTFAQLYQGEIISNAVISVLIIIISISKFQNNVYCKLLNILSNISINKTIIFFSFIVMCSSFVFYLSYYNKNNFFNLLVNFIIITVYFSIIVMIIKKESKYKKIYSKYVTSINELEEYERIINEYRIINHENENQLFAIKGLTTNKKVKEYIDEIINHNNSENEMLIKQALLIPTGGLRGLIYSKLIVMKNKNINYLLNIDKKISNKIMSNITSTEMLDICQIIGVYLDNSIDAVQNANEKQIIINIYKDDSINIEIINTYNNIIDLNKIDKAGYTTKGSNHGYGLALVNRILNKNKNFSNEREVTSNFFKQKLVVKI